MSRQRRRLTASEDGTVYRDGVPVPVSKNGFGYLKCRAGHETFKVHRIVAEELLGPPGIHATPELGALLGHVRQWDVAHKNRDKHDNRIANLMWCPHSFNIVHENECPLLADLRRHRVRRKRRELSDKPPRQKWRDKARLFSRCSWCGTSMPMRWRHRNGHRYTQQFCSLACSGSSKAKLSDLGVEEIRALTAAGVSSRVLSRLHNISRSLVHRIARKEKRRKPCIAKGEPEMALP